MHFTQLEYRYIFRDIIVESHPFEWITLIYLFYLQWNEKNKNNAYAVQKLSNIYLLYLFLSFVGLLFGIHWFYGLVLNVLLYMVYSIASTPSYFSHNHTEQEITIDDYTYDMPTKLKFFTILLLQGHYSLGNIILLYAMNDMNSIRTISPYWLYIAGILWGAFAWTELPTFIMRTVLIVCTDFHIHQQFYYLH